MLCVIGESRRGIAAGTQLDVSGGAGIDSLLLGDLSLNTSSILGPVNFDTGADAGQIQVLDSFRAIGKVAHLGLNSRGTFPGDTLFGPGGSLAFTTLVNAPLGVSLSTVAMSIRLGGGADTIYAQPFATGTVQVVVTDDGLGINVISLTGSDAALFELDGAALYLKAGTGLDFETTCWSIACRDRWMTP